MMHADHKTLIEGMERHGWALMEVWTAERDHGPETVYDLEHHTDGKLDKFASIEGDVLTIMHMNGNHNQYQVSDVLGLEVL